MFIIKRELSKFSFVALVLYFIVFHFSFTFTFKIAFYFCKPAMTKKNCQHVLRIIKQTYLLCLSVWMGIITNISYFSLIIEWYIFVDNIHVLCVMFCNIWMNNLKACFQIHTYLTPIYLMANPKFSWFHILS